MPRKESIELRERAKRFGEQLKALRKVSGLTQRQTAAIMGIDDSGLSRIEKGKHYPPRETSFYEGLKNLPNCSEFDIQSLFATATGIFNGNEFIIPRATLPRAVFTPVEGMIVHIFADPDKIDDTILERVKTEFRWDAQSIVEKTLERRRILGE